ncbi:hypothetical protein [Allorhizocola rhizosphaerae]|uniref:hypothetical protein n=1 Tax=Allorhizocola rhizosphaerae TaxID=1872709 RepID=UPI000E3BFD93|nr:hypothetical protein [Allorhizocola rhizosphaerae]
METLTPVGRAVRVVVTLTGVALLFVTSTWGSDDHFPFAPFRMYAGENPPNEPAPDPRIDATTVDGRVIVLGQRQTGLRRAEIEAKQDAFAANPSLLCEVAKAYDERNPAGPRLAEVRYVLRLHEIQASRPTGRHTDKVLAAWPVPK